jgi:hypothetical protein
MHPFFDSLAYHTALWAWAPAALAASLLVLLARRGRRAPAQDRRGDVRRGGDPVPVWLLDAAGEVAGRAVVLDRSERGLRLAVDGPHPVGTVLRIWPLDPPPDVPPVEAEVRWCRRGGLRNEVGCRFIAPPPAVLQLFG